MTEKTNDIFAASNQQNNTQQFILILTADYAHDLEFFYPYYRFIEEGFYVDVVTPNGGEFKCKHGMGLKETKKIEDVKAESYQLLYIPGGHAPEELKTNRAALELTCNFAASGKPIAAICSGPQVLAAAGLIRGYNISASPEVEKEITDAGGNFLNEETVIAGQFITARNPGALPLHVARTLDALRDKSGRFAGNSTAIWF